MDSLEPVGLLASQRHPTENSLPILRRASEGAPAQDRRQCRPCRRLRRDSRGLAGAAREVGGKSTLARVTLPCSRQKTQRELQSPRPSLSEPRLTTPASVTTSKRQRFGVQIEGGRR